jgi:ABC-2 type transport system permease protein
MAPSSARQIATVAKYELLKYLRGWRLLVLVLLILINSAIWLIVPSYLGVDFPTDPKVFVINIISFLGVVCILSATFFGADAIVSEYESKTGYVLFPNPIRKTAIFVGKFIASALVSVGAISLYYGIAVVSVRAVDGSIPDNTGLSFLYSLTYVFAILAIAYLFSAVMRSSVYSLVLTFFTFFLLLPMIASIGSIAKYKMWFIVTFASGISQYVLEDPYPSDKVLTAPPGVAGAGSVTSLAQYYPEIRLSLIVMAAYFVIAFALGIFLAQRREM